jgi:hypothetical protein
LTLQSEVDAQRRTIRTDGYPMSINELASMYREDELELHPEFQRYFRWTTEQKSRLIESLLLGIPIPSFFVHQRSDGVWDVVDGLQRLSAIFQVMGILRGVDGEILPPLTMTATKYLPSLEGRRWGANEADPNGIGGDLQRLLKRSKLDIKIVLRESDADTRLELFQRLNTGGTQLSDQELRNCQILMVSGEVLDTLRAMSEFPSFQNVVALSDRSLEEQYDLELVVRFIVLRHHKTEGLGALGQLLDDEIIEIARNTAFDWDHERDVFDRTFVLLNDSLGVSAFRRCNEHGQPATGGFIVSLFEVFALGVGYHLEDGELSSEQVSAAHKSFWENQGVLVQFRGRQAGDRLRTTLPMGRTLFGGA